MELGPSSMGLKAVQNSTRFLRQKERHFKVRGYVERAVFLRYSIPLFILNTQTYNTPSGDDGKWLIQSCEGGPFCRRLTTMQKERDFFSLWHHCCVGRALRRNGLTKKRHVP